MPVDAPEIVETDNSRVACDGGGGALGHPKVFLEMGDETQVECPYCDKRFVLRAGATHH
ncbi:MAG: zinc-finger domain-containing protein [Pseudomonadota bacterium]